MSMEVHPSHVLKGGARQSSASLKYHPQPRITGRQTARKRKSPTSMDPIVLGTTLCVTLTGALFLQGNWGGDCLSLSGICQELGLRECGDGGRSGETCMTSAWPHLVVMMRQCTEGRRCHVLGGGAASRMPWAAEPQIHSLGLGGGRAGMCLRWGMTLKWIFKNGCQGGLAVDEPA